ncbi:phosphoadenosine phosphosulfate reductase family protein [Noviherbaspirillum sp. 17J57-3]|uniref:Phosphoadenosine phosphosulfate reductase family protein n=2 Tax=Noviherbaspirillum galbum TaxID=2709383 RepID=A0A6B3SMV7_9BURK|nr:phosphoadenosine phosphosulfate reductase family protein [Noviherbaspirillum galbum]
MTQPPLFVTADTLDPFVFDRAIIGLSGGKDSIACLLHLFEIGYPKERIECWHHDVDGREAPAFMDWPCTRDYCRKLCEALDIPLYFSWRQGGFEREMLRENQLTAPVLFETPDGIGQAGGVRGEPNTRRKFPQQAASLSTRYCSSSLKIDVCSTAIANQPRFEKKRTLLVTGERAEESRARAGYAIAEHHKTSNGKREVWQWRPVHGWTEQQVWDIMEKYRINPHPAYHLGWGRASCMTCIFGSPSQWASVYQIAPQRVIKIHAYEQDFDCTLRRDGDIMKAVNRGTPYDMDPHYVQLALSEEYTDPILVEDWKLPKGAFGESCGPT